LGKEKEATMRYLAIMFALSMVLTLASGGLGCEGSGETPGPTATLEVTPTPMATATETPGPTATAQPTPSPGPSPQALFLEISQPSDGAEVSTSPIAVSGMTLPEAVVSVSVNDDLEIADVDQSGSFSVTVNLEEGPNLVEVIASDAYGNVKSSSIVINYLL
jgi:hypothetical protein